jgi:hypothetical protein
VCISQFILEDGGILDPMIDLQVEILAEEVIDNKTNQCS